MMNFGTILVVCTGNICRSPMAEVLLRHEYPERYIHSAGTHGLTGSPADPLALQCLNTVSLDGSQHIAKKLTSEHVKQADLIITMSQRQSRFIEEQWAFARGKVFRLGHWQKQDIPDPYQQSPEFFLQVFKQIQHCMSDWRSFLQE